jgi:hypothetical protein
MLIFMFRSNVCSFVKIGVEGLKLTLFGHKSGRKGVKLTTATKGHPDIFFDIGEPQTAIDNRRFDGNLTGDLIVSRTSRRGRGKR